VSLDARFKFVKIKRPLKQNLRWALRAANYCAGSSAYYPLPPTSHRLLGFFSRLSCVNN